MTADSERMSVVEVELKNHIKNDEAAIARIESTGTEIKEAVRELSRDMKDAVQRIHGRIDEAEEKARTLASEAANIARAESKIAIGLAQDAHARVDSTKIWILSGVLAGGAALVGVIATVIEIARSARVAG